MTAPQASIVIPTRDRAGRVVTAVEALLAEGRNGDIEIIVVDQSRDDATRRAVEGLVGNGATRYVRDPGRGSASARNVGIASASAEIVGLTDDDCEPRPGWVRELTEAFAADTGVAVVFGNVVPAEHDAAAGFIPGHIRSEVLVARSVSDKPRIDGMAACMGVRRSAWEALGGFDTMLGSGAPLRSAAEGDLALRALAAGQSVASAPALEVVHHGFRTWEEGRQLVSSYWYGTGAMLAKAVKRRQPAVLPLLARLSWRWAFGRSPVAASLGTRPHRWLRLAAFLRGFGAGLATPVDSLSGRYRPPR